MSRAQHTYRMVAQCECVHSASVLAQCRTVKNIHEVLAILKAATIATKFGPKILVLAYHRPGIYCYEMCNLAWS